MAVFLERWKDADLDKLVQDPGRPWRRYAYGLVKFSWLSLRALLEGYK